MTDEKRTVCGLEVKFAMHIGEREVVFLLDPQNEETPYMVGNYTLNSLGMEQVAEIIGSGDYLEVVDEFLDRVKGQVVQVRAGRKRFDEPQEVFGTEHCLPGGMEHSLQGMVVVIKPDMLRPEYRNVASQLVLVSGGNGASPNARGQSVFGNTVFSGERSTWRRYDVLGVLDPAKAPSWLKSGVAAIQTQKKSKEKGGKPHEL